MEYAPVCSGRVLLLLLLSSEDTERREPLFAAMMTRVVLSRDETENVAPAAQVDAQRARRKNNRRH
jgi:hypothetical protein